MRKSAASSCAGRGRNQITLPVLLMISGPLTLPPLGVMKMSPLLLFAPCFSTVTAGALAGAGAPDDTVLQAVPVKTMTAAAAAATASDALPRREPAARHETPLSPIARLRPFRPSLPRWTATLPGLTQPQLPAPFRLPRRRRTLVSGRRVWAG